MKTVAGSIAAGTTWMPIPGRDGTAASPAASPASPVSAALHVHAVVAADLTYLREEEKLARDVCLVLGGCWGLEILADVSASEQRHMDAVLHLLASAGLPDPAAGNGVGEFADPELAWRYTALVARGLASPAAALAVGATVEDLDLRDLEEAALDTQDPRILSVYDELQGGSRDHLRLFHHALLAQGVTYEAQFIRAELLRRIVTSDREAGSP